MYELRFHEETDRVYDGAKMMYPLHCGDALKFEIDGVFIAPLLNWMPSGTPLSEG
jgi:hypothetical protein